MRYFLYIVLIPLFIAGCSGNKEVNKAMSSSSTKDVVDNPKQKAMEHFLNGSVAEQETDYQKAVSEYQSALQYDSSGGIFYALAKSYLAQHKLSNALQNSRISIQYEPNELAYYNLMADIFIVARENDSAAVVLEKMIEIAPNEVNTYYKLARVYENSKPIEAIRIYEKLTNVIGPEWNILIHVSELYEKLSFKKEAAESLEKLLAIDPSNIALQKMIIEFYQRNENYDAALIMLDDIIELTPDDLDAREKKAQILIQKGDWKAASQEYKQILKEEDILLEVKIGIGASFFEVALTDSSVLPITKEIFETIDQDTSDWQVNLYLGAIALNEGDDSTAIEYFNFVTENAPWNSQAWIRLGGLYFDNRKYDEAEKLMREAVDMFPNDFAVNLILGLSLAQNSKTEEAEPFLLKTVKLNRGDLTALSAYAFTLSQLGREEESIEYIKIALKIEPNDVNLLGQLGLSYNNLNYMAQSDSAYEEALKLDLQNALINNNYAYSLSERGLQLERSLKMVNIALDADSANSSYLDTKGWIYFKLGEYEKAREFIEKAIDEGGENAVMLEHLGDIMFMSDKQIQAVEIWKKALDLDSENESLLQKIKSGVI
ncbi:MAG: tetratricopeptide repeat protein [Ignavibacteria bacterium]|nr:tetratricopeptide repeat protein [Ignavibacteria bacterium]